MSKLVKCFKKRDSLRSDLDKINRKLGAVEHEIQKILGAGYFSVTAVKKLIDKKLWENLTPLNREMVLKFREDKNSGSKITESWASTDGNSGSFSYYCTPFFDPEEDSYTIVDIRCNQRNDVKVVVSCDKNVKYMGRDGSYIPDLYETDWFPMSELEAAEDNNSGTFFA